MPKHLTRAIVATRLAWWNRKVVKRTAHLTVQVTERPLKIARVAADADASTGKKRDAAAAKPARAKKTTAKTAAKA